MKRKRISLLLLPLAVIIVGFAVWGPEALAEYRDSAILNRITPGKRKPEQRAIAIF